ncbi:hypothetical protein WA026_016792 [Henosepilachna vigintioctopunctata]|uniref:Uncharacterized protein n=1 Tax=Henosepilachna vigintioctopunctata TaxID=420089 RepID=A0AAW1UZH6_9CUCU
MWKHFPLIMFGKRFPKYFKTNDPKIICYIIQKHVNAEQVHDIIAGKENFREVAEVKEIPGNPEGLKRFVVTAPIRFKEKMYSPEFWSVGVGIKRFSFNEYRKENGYNAFLSQSIPNKAQAR